MFKEFIFINKRDDLFIKIKYRYDFIFVLQYFQNEVIIAPRNLIEIN